MSPRAALQSLIETDAQLIALGVGEVYGSNSVDTAEEDVFIVLHWEDQLPAFESVGLDRVLIWVHDKSRDYGTIDLILARIKVIMYNAVHVAGPDGGVISTTKWNGDSRDLYDDGFNTITRNGDYSVASR